MDDDGEGEIVEFCRRVQPRLISSMALHCGRVEVAEDVAQEALARAWQRWSTVSQLDSPERWVYRVALNLSTSALRRRRIELRPHRTVGRAVVDVDRADAIVVRDALARLPVRQRSALVLRYFADFSVNDTASVMGCAPGTVKALTSQGLERLRRELVGGAVEDEAKGRVER